jgi:hypothetical protein
MPVNTSAFIVLSRGALKGNTRQTVEAQLSTTTTQTQSTRPPEITEPRLTPLGAMMHEREVPTWKDVIKDVTAAKDGYCTAQEAEKIYTWASRIDHSMVRS